MNKFKLLKASTASSIVTIIFVVVITVWGELSAPLKAWLAGFSGHHWTSKSIFSVLIFAVATLILYAIQKEPGEGSVHRTLNSLLVFTFLGVLALTAFYTGHHLGIY